MAIDAPGYEDLNKANDMVALDNIDLEVYTWAYVMDCIFRVTSGKRLSSI